MNIGDSEEIVILWLAQKIKQLTGSASSLIFHPLPEDDPQRRCPDLNKAESLLEWKRMVELEQGLQKTIRLFRVESCA